MSPTQNKTPRKRAKPLQAAPGQPTDPVRLARWRAIKMAGGASHVGRALGFSKGEAVRLWYVDRDPTAEQARKLVELVDGAVTLREILPSAFDGLSAQHLGYAPA